jgi:hypothetical protein
MRRKSPPQSKQKYQSNITRAGGRKGKHEQVHFYGSPRQHAELRTTKSECRSDFTLAVDRPKFKDTVENRLGRPYRMEEQGGIRRPDTSTKGRQVW